MDKVIGIRLNDEMKKELELIADNFGISVSELVRKIIERNVEEYKKASDAYKMSRDFVKGV